MKRNTSVDIFAISDLAIAALHALGLLFMVIALVYGIFFSGDAEEEVFMGVLGSIIIIVPLLAGLVVYGSAGFGLIKRKSWGYYMHIAASVLAFFSVLLIAYAVVSFVFVFKPEFRQEFFVD
ncbi:MAG: hypothetical protein E3J78_02925 [Candidatus Cloacimonadota bacterium]|nr:MAG: hypothetical protein E3J78_02925 [Candidatus Cloacimonadota bacterium]